MSTKYGLLILAGVFVVAGAIVYYKTATPAPRAQPQTNNTNGKALNNAITSGVAGLVNSGFNGLNGLFGSPRAGVSARQPILPEENLSSGVKHLTNLNDTTGTTGDTHVDFAATTSTTS